MVSGVGTAIWVVLERCGRSAKGFPLDASNGVVRLLCERGYIQALGRGVNGSSNLVYFSLTPLGRAAVESYPTKRANALHHGRRRPMG